MYSILLRYFLSCNFMVLWMKLSEFRWIKWCCNSTYRNLSLYGKSVILKTLALPKIMYVCTTMIPNIEFIKAIHTEIRKFFWKGGIPKIKENVLTCDFKDGGIKMLDISLMIKARRYS